MELFIKNCANLVKVKTLTTIAVMAVFVILSLRGDISPDNAMIIVSTVTGFYFGTVSEKKKEADHE